MVRLVTLSLSLVLATCLLPSRSSAGSQVTICDELQLMVGGGVVGQEKKRPTKIIISNQGPGQLFCGPTVLDAQDNPFQIPSPPFANPLVIPVTPLWCSSPICASVTLNDLP